MEAIISTAFNSGLWDSLNPCNLANLIVYTFMLFYFCRTAASVRLFAVSFIISSMIITYHVLHGVFYNFYTIGWLFDLLQYSYLALSIVIIIAGCIHFIDWKNLLTSKDLDKVIIKQTYVIPAPGRKPLNFLIVLLVSFLAGAVLSFMMGVWPMGWNIYNYWAEAAVVGDMITSILVLMLYTLFLMIPFIFVTTVFLSSMRIKINQDFLVRKIALVKIMTAGFYIAVGLGLSYIVLR
ncbi:MAG: hypothetical protein K8S27_08230 [Candidatus Omnitrophica bacterium]|nr:hypothetical protein [Candidatus Omnitrophota bacterium]